MGDQMELAKLRFHFDWGQLYCWFYGICYQCDAICGGCMYPLGVFAARSMCFGLRPSRYLKLPRNAWGVCELHQHCTVQPVLRTPY